MVLRVHQVLLVLEGVLQVQRELWELQVPLVFLELMEQRVQQAFFDGEGCAISQAAASILCEHIEGMTLKEIETFDAPAMLELLQVQLTAVRQRCGLLGFKALKTLVYSHDGASA